MGNLICVKEHLGRSEPPQYDLQTHSHSSDRKQVLNKRLCSHMLLVPTALPRVLGMLYHCSPTKPIWPARSPWTAAQH